MDKDHKMLRVTLFVCFTLRVLGQKDDSQFGKDEDLDLADFDLGIVRGKNEQVV